MTVNGQDMEQGRETYEKDFGDRQTALLIHGDNIAATNVLAARYMSSPSTPELQRGFIDIGFTSPPYNQAYPAQTKGSGSSLGRFGYDLHDDCMDEKDYQEWQVDVLWHMYRIMMPNGSLFYNHKVRTKVPRRGLNGNMTKESGVFVHPIEWLKKSHFRIKQELVWDQRSSHQQNTAMFTPVDERVFWLYKPRFKPSVGGGKPSGSPATGTHITIPTVIQARKASRELHPAPFPRSIVNSVLKPFLAPGRFPDKRALVMDPHAGSGTTGMVALSHGANVILVDISKDYLDAAEERIRRSFPNIRITRWDLNKEDE
jgi:site-specific DNA-methyltransferase (adenine-specific)